MARCRNCKQVFNVKFFNQKFCTENDECQNAMIDFAIKESIKKKSQENTKWKKEQKLKLKTHKDWLKDLEREFNHFIRVRDMEELCISCGAPKGYTLTAGHFFPAGSFGNIRFDEENVNGQCWWNCNKNQHGNFPNYEIGLRAKLGDEKVDALKVRAYQSVSKLTIPEIQEKIAYYKAKVKDLINKREKL